MNPSTRFFPHRFHLGWLLLALGVFALPTGFAARARTLTLNLELAHLQYSQWDPNFPGGAYYTVNVLLNSDLAPLTIDEVDSPPLAGSTNLAFVGTETGCGEYYFTDLDSITDTITNGTWTLIVNKGDPSQEQYFFTVSLSGLAPAMFSTSQIYLPLDGNTAVATNTPFYWSDPMAWDDITLTVFSLDDSFSDAASFATVTTNWTDAPILPPGTNEFEVTCQTNGTTWFTVSTPTNNLSQPFTNLVIQTTLSVFNQSAFLVTLTATNPPASTNNPIALGDAVNAPQLAWATSGDADWFGEATNADDGVAAAQSGVIDAGQTSTLETTVTVTNAQTDVFFWCQIQDDDDDFTLSFYMDGALTFGTTGGQPWSQAGPFTLVTGVHTLQWIASADASGTDSPTNDAAWVDEVSLVPVPTLTATDSPRVGQVPLTVQFTAPAVDDAGNAITSWSWDFGDGTAGNTQNASHTYTRGGTFTPGLWVADAAGVDPIINGLNPVTALTLSPAQIAANLPGALGDFTYDNFRNPKSLQLLGNAASVTTADGPVLQLTPSAIGQAGAAWSAAPIALTPGGGFSTFFMFRLSQPGGMVDIDGVPGGDGIAFLIQSAGYLYGTAGGGLGYEGIPNSLAVEFDTWDNGPQNGTPGDINGNHVAINSNGAANDPISVPVTDPLNNGQIWYVWIDYDGLSQDLEVRLSETPVRPLTNLLSTPVNLPAILGTTNAFVGFTAATGAAYEEQDILAWKFMALPTTRVTGTFALTNPPPGFLINDGVVLEQYQYVVAGLRFTNYTCAPMIFTTNADGQIAFATALGNFGPDALDDAVNDQAAAIEAALSTNAAAPEAADANINSFALLAAYANSTSPDTGALLNSYDHGTGYPAFLLNADFDTVYPLDEDDYVTLLGQVAANPPPGLFPPPVLTQLAAADPASDGVDAPLLIPPDADGNCNGWSTTFRPGREAGTVTARQQVVYSAPMPLLIFSPRNDGANFVFDFVTVSNQNYTVWANPDLATANWGAYTNLPGDGYLQKITVALTNQAQNFFRLSSP